MTFKQTASGSGASTIVSFMALHPIHLHCTSGKRNMENGHDRGVEAFDVTTTVEGYIFTGVCVP